MHRKVVGKVDGSAQLHLSLIRVDGELAFQQLDKERADAIVGGAGGGWLGGAHLHDLVDQAEHHCSYRVIFIGIAAVELFLYILEDFPDLLLLPGRQLVDGVAAGLEDRVSVQGSKVLKEIRGKNAEIAGLGPGRPAAIWNHGVAKEEGALLDFDRSVGVVVDILSDDEAYLVIASPAIGGGLAIWAAERFGWEYIKMPHITAARTEIQYVGEKAFGIVKFHCSNFRRHPGPGITQIKQKVIKIKQYLCEQVVGYSFLIR